MRGDSCPARTEQAAMKISGMGLNYETYVELAIKLCKSFMKHFGWKYPYYNAVISDKTIAKVKGMVNYADVLETKDDTELFENELLFATQYIEWWFGRGERPYRNGIDVPMTIRSDVAEYLCRLYGLQFTSSNYNIICRALERYG